MKTSLSIIAIVLCVAAFASAQEADCPKAIKVHQTIDATPQGWTADTDGSDHILAGVTFFSGPPEEKASLVYDNWKKRDGLAYAVWNFQPDSTHRIWLSCRYANTDVVLTKELPEKISQCNVTYNPKTQVAGLPEIRNMTCH